MEPARPLAPSPPPLNHGRRSAEAVRERARLAQLLLGNCHGCEHHCGVNRLAGERGRCHAGPDARVFSAQVEVGDELELIPTFAIVFSGCDLRCHFCITARQSWNPQAGRLMDAAALARKAEAALAEGARSIMFLGGEPAIHLAAVLEVVALLPDNARLVWKTNAHASAQSRALLEGLFDVWLPDYKFGNDDCARRWAGVADYTRIVRENLRWMSEQAAGLDGNACGSHGARRPGTEECAALSRRRLRPGIKSDLIVRHLLMPGHVDCCWRPIAGWLASNLPGVKVSLRTEFWPRTPRGQQTECARAISVSEREDALRLAHDFGLNVVP